MSVEQTLQERGTRYGEFDEHARITQAIKNAMKTGRNWACLAPDMKEALEMVAHKVGRILNGDPTYVDSWHDISGYCMLVEKRLEKPTGPGVASIEILRAQLEAQTLPGKRHTDVKT